MIKKGNMTDAEYIAALEKEHIREIRRLENEIKREFDEKRIEKTAGICYNENNYKLQKQKGGFFYGTNSNFL